MIKFNTLAIQICVLIFRLLILRLQIQDFHKLSYQNRNETTFLADETKTQYTLDTVKARVTSYQETVV